MDGEAAGKGVAELFTGESTLEDLVVGTNVDGVDLVPASPWLVGIDRAMAGEVGAETILRTSLQGATPGRWSHCLIDCPPALTLVDLVESAVLREIERLEKLHNDGERFPARDGELRIGRPIGA